jgi:lipopolysaccharide export system permease protein
LARERVRAVKILDRYIAKEVLAAVALVLFALVLLYAFLDVIFQLSDLGKGGYRLRNIFTFVALSTPAHVYELLPIAALIGTLYALTQLGTHSELTVMRASGLSLSAIAGTLVIVGVALGLLNMLFGEVIAPQTDQLAKRYRLQALNQVLGQEFRSGLWVKDAGTFVNIREMLPDSTLRELRVYEFDESNRLKAISIAQRGTYVGNNEWRISDVQKTLFENGEVRLQRLKESVWKSVVTPEILSVLLVVPEQMSVWNLFTYIQHLRENKQSTTRYEIAQWAKLLHPFGIVVLMVLALPFSIQKMRSGGASGKIFVGIILGLSFHLLNRLFMSVGYLNDWNALVSAALPSMLFLAAAVMLIVASERGASVRVRAPSLRPA